MKYMHFAVPNNTFTGPNVYTKKIATTGAGTMLVVFYWLENLK